MVTRTPTAAALLIAVGLIGCSKTQDTAPQTRVFGDPPTIGSVTLTAQTRLLDCDVTVALQGKFCEGGSLNRDSYAFSPGPTVSVRVGYTEFYFRVQATDAQSTPGQNDILLVAASFQSPGDQGTIEETSLIVLDDGGSLKFPWKQTAPVEDCTFFSDPPFCTCAAKFFDLTTGDTTADDNVFSRGFAFIAPGGGIPPNAFGAIETCVAKVAKESPYSSTFFINRDLDFKIEAIDRAGNDTIWPARPVGHIDPTSYSCTGDDCACCILGSGDPLTDCVDKPGMIALTPDAGWPVGTGLCDSFG